MMSKGSGACEAESVSGQIRPFTADGRLFRLAAEAERIRLAPLFDPYVAVHASRIEPLPHQITAVYGEMLPRQPLRFLLADDPGAGKTIMAGLLIRELMLRGDLERCLVVAPAASIPRGPCPTSPGRSGTLPRRCPRPAGQPGRAMAGRA